MLASTLNQCSHLINTDEKIVCKNLQLLFAVERLLIEHEKQIQDRINELSNEEDRKAKYALMHDCYVHYQFFDRKLTIRRELYLEYLFHSAKQHVKQAEAVIQSLEDHIQSLEDYTQSEEDYTVEKLDLRFLTTILMIVRRVDAVLLDRIEDLRIVAEQNKDEPFYYYAENCRDLYYRVNETVKLKCRLFQIFSRDRTNAIYTEEVLQQKALLESILLEVQSLMAKTEADLNALDEGMDQLPVIEMVRQILKLDPSVHERLQPKKLDADMNQVSDP